VIPSFPTGLARGWWLTPVHPPTPHNAGNPDTQQHSIELCSPPRSHKPLSPPPFPVIDEYQLLVPCTEMASTAVVLEPPRHKDQKWRQEEDDCRADSTPPPSTPTPQPSRTCSRYTAKKKGGRRRMPAQQAVVTASSLHILSCRP